MWTPAVGALVGLFLPLAVAVAGNGQSGARPSPQDSSRIESNRFEINLEDAVRNGLRQLARHLAGNAPNLHFTWGTPQAYALRHLPGTRGVVFIVRVPVSCVTNAAAVRLPTGDEFESLSRKFVGEQLLDAILDESRMLHLDPEGQLTVVALAAERPEQKLPTVPGDRRCESGRLPPGRHLPAGCAEARAGSTGAVESRRHRT